MRAKEKNIIIQYLNEILLFIEKEDYKKAKEQVIECFDTIKDSSYFHDTKISLKRNYWPRSKCNHPGLDEFGNFKSMPTGCGYDK